MSSTYAELVSRVRDWSNRDAEALPNSVIQDGLRYAADTAYRELMVPPLEHTTNYVLYDATEGNYANASTANNAFFTTVTNTGTNPTARGFAELPIPGDLVKYIHLRVRGTVRVSETDSTMLDLDANGNLMIDPTPYASGIVFNEKADVRTFYDMEAEKYNVNLWTRHGDNTLVAGSLSHGLVVELYYYRRLAAQGARYDVSGITDATDPRLTTTYRLLDTPTTDTTVAAGLTSINGFDVTTTTINNVVYTGREAPNWLRDENEKVILFGALYHCYDYLADTEESARMAQKFAESIEELNREERMRRGSGGNVQVNFNGFGMI